MARSELLTAVLAALLAIASHAQDTAPPKEPGSLSGVVTNALTGDPVLHAHVTLQPIGSAAEQTVLGALSDGEGKFSLTQIPAGRYAVSVEKTSFTPKLTPATSMLTFGNGEKKTGLQLALLPGGVITGRVLDSRGEPMENVRVGALAGSGGTTDEEGRYRIGGLPPGRQRVSAMMYSLPIPAEHRTDGSEELHHAVTFYQSSSTLEGAQWVQVRPGAETAGVDIRMVRVPVLKISGRVAGIPAGMQAALRLRLRNSYPNISGGGMTQPRADGTFDIWRVNPGKYWLQAGSVGGGEPLQSAAVAVDVESTSIENVELKVIPPETIRGVVRWDGEAPPDSSPAGSGAGGGDTKSAGLGQKRLNFSPTSGFSGFGGGMLDAVIADDGTFTLQRVQPGAYRLRYSDIRAFVKSTRVGSRDSEGRTIDLSQGSGGETVTIVLSSAVASLSGVVRKGADPVQGVNVALMEDVMSMMFPRMAITGADGRYKLTGLAPGTYELVMLGEGDLRGGMLIPGALEGEEIRLAPGENAIRDLRWAPPGEQQ